MIRCLVLLSLLRGEGKPIDLGRLISENIKYMAIAAQRDCRYFCAINELCSRAGVPVMTSPKVPLNASAIRSLQHMHQTEASKNHQKDNQAGNDERFYQSQVQK